MRKFATITLASTFLMTSLASVTLAQAQETVDPAFSAEEIIGVTVQAWNTGATKLSQSIDINAGVSSSSALSHLDLDAEVLIYDVVCAWNNIDTSNEFDILVDRFSTAFASADAEIDNCHNFINATIEAWNNSQPLGPNSLL